MSKQYDVVIIGSGPAGLSAAIYATRGGLDFVVLEGNYVSGGQVLNTDEVDNYPGFPQIKGFELGMKMHEHATKLGAKFVMKKAKEIKKESDGFLVVLEDGTSLATKNVIVATGANPAMLSVPGEKELRGKGVSYCATCDGNFFKGKVVAVVGGGNTAMADAVYLSRICEKVYVIHRRDDFRGSAQLKEQLLELENVEVLWNTVVEEIMGTDVVERIATRNVELDMTGDINVDGVFVAVGSKPETQVLQGIVELDDYGYVLADETCKTSCDGIFVAGDIRKKAMRQIVTAVADGANAVNSVVSTQNHKN